MHARQPLCLWSLVSHVSWLCLQGRASLAESRLDTVNGLQAALAAKIAEVETLKAGEEREDAEQRSQPKPLELSSLPGNIRVGSPLCHVSLFVNESKNASWNWYLRANPRSC
jgi:hypothetical protein